jgi:hypothetical protein
MPDEVEFHFLLGVVLEVCLFKVCGDLAHLVLGAVVLQLLVQPRMVELILVIDIVVVEVVCHRNEGS